MQGKDTSLYAIGAHRAGTAKSGFLRHVSILVVVVLGFVRTFNHVTMCKCVRMIVVGRMKVAVHVDCHAGCKPKGTASLSCARGTQCCWQAMP